MTEASMEDAGYKSGYDAGFDHRIAQAPDIDRKVDTAGLRRLLDAAEAELADLGTKAEYRAWRQKGWADGYLDASEAIAADFRAAEGLRIRKTYGVARDVDRYLRETGNDPEDQAAALEWLEENSQAYEDALEDGRDEANGRVYRRLAEHGYDEAYGPEGPDLLVKAG